MKYFIPTNDQTKKIEHTSEHFNLYPNATRLKLEYLSSFFTPMPIDDEYYLDNNVFFMTYHPYIQLKNSSKIILLAHNHIKFYLNYEFRYEYIENLNKLSQPINVEFKMYYKSYSGKIYSSIINNVNNITPYTKNSVVNGRIPIYMKNGSELFFTVKPKRTDLMDNNVIFGLSSKYGKSVDFTIDIIPDFTYTPSISRNVFYDNFIFNGIELWYSEPSNQSKQNIMININNHNSNINLIPKIIRNRYHIRYGYINKNNIFINNCNYMAFSGLIPLPENFNIDLYTITISGHFGQTKECYNMFNNLSGKNNTLINKSNVNITVIDDDLYIGNKLLVWECDYTEEFKNSISGWINYLNYDNSLPLGDDIEDNVCKYENRGLATIFMFTLKYGSKIIVSKKFTVYITSNWNVLLEYL